jgi:mRNA interferase MazF
MKVSQKDIVNISLSPTRGKEQRGVRPAVVISGNAFHSSGLCVICPLTSKLHKFQGDVILRPDSINKLKTESEVLVGHVRSVSQGRISKKIGVIQTSELTSIFEGIDLIFNR